MRILSISDTNYNKRNSITFNQKSKVLTSSAGRLKISTTRNVNNVLTAYKDIVKKLSRKNDEGIKFIHENFPDITIGENLIFHNCGDDKTSILIKVGEGFSNMDYTRIIERQGASSEANRIVKNSFLLSKNEKLIKIDSDDNQMIYPKELNYYTEDEMENSKLEDNLNTVLEKLDEKLLRFRIFLNKILNEYTKIPDGKINLDLISKFERIESTTEELNIALQQLPKKVSLEFRHLFNDYKMISGQTYPMFVFPKEEECAILYYPIDSRHEEKLKRLTVFDLDSQVLKNFVLTTDGKMVKNINQKSETFLPNKLQYFNEEELIKEDLLPIFKNYLRLYTDKLFEYKSFIFNKIQEREERLSSIDYEIPQNNQDLMMSILDDVNSISVKLRMLNGNTAADIKKSIENLYAPPGRKGVTFDGYEGDKKVYFLPVNSKVHTNLVRLTVINPDDTEKVLLIKDGKYIVKNYNPAYPLVVPPKLIYAKEFSEDFELSKVLEYLKSNTFSYREVVETEVNAVKKKKEALLAKQLYESEIRKQQEEKRQQRELEKKRALYKKRYKEHVEKERKEQERLRNRVKDNAVTKQSKFEDLEKNKLLKEKESRLEAKRQKKSLQAKKELVKTLKSQLDELKITIKNNSSDFVDKVINLQNILSNYINSQK